MKRVGVDIGGTFTDLVWLDEQGGRLGKTKALSTRDPLDGLETALVAGGIDAQEISVFLHATTLITNLVLERRGATVGLVTTKGFRDVLEIQTGLKPNPYDIHWQRTEPLVPRSQILEIDERIDATGAEVVVPDDDEIEAGLRSLVDAGVDSIAVCFLHSYANSANEARVAAVAHRVWPELHVSLSSEIDPRIREYPRMSTTVANAYAMPAFEDYATRLGDKLAVESGIKFMQSSGGVVAIDQAARAPVNLVYSGPVGGVLGARRLGRLCGIDNLITLDMGGTSSDVCVIHGGEAGEKEELFIEWGLPIRTQTVDIHAIGAGGGSIATVDTGGALQVGPQSAGASPGPACYGRGGTQPTVTDANLVLGLVRPDTFAGGEMLLDREAAERALAPIAEHFDVTVQEAAFGVFRMVNSAMAQAIREITVYKGIDPRRYTLVGFGGCGPQHAAEVAREVGMRHVIVPTMPSVFSAMGLLTADLVNDATRTILSPLAKVDLDDLQNVLGELERVATVPLLSDVPAEEIVVRRVLYMRYIGQSHELAVALDQLDRDALHEAFESAHERTYGTRLGDAVEVVDAKVTAVGAIEDVPAVPWEGGTTDAAPTDTVTTAFGEAPVFQRGDLAASSRIPGPALVEEGDSTLYLPTGSEAVIDEHGNIGIDVGC